jgi:hypothetical protein
MQPDTVDFNRRIVHCPKSRSDKARDRHLSELLISVQRAIGGDAVFFEEDKSRKMWRAFTGVSFEKSDHRAEWGTKAGSLRRLRNVRTSETPLVTQQAYQQPYHGPTHSSASVLDSLANRARHAKVPVWKTAIRVAGIGLAGLIVLAAIAVLGLHVVTRWSADHAVAPVVRRVVPAPAVASEEPDVEIAPPVIQRRQRRRQSEEVGR